MLPQLGCFINVISSYASIERDCFSTKCHRNVAMTGRKSPGVLLQGDTLHALCAQVADALADGPCSSDELQDVHSKLLVLLAHYTSVLCEHQLHITFSRSADA
ncbi:DUF6959 family protein [Xanthomonas hortorum]|uniref:DUF6959 family protein n=1 Tax=Xanthomonas hortorum TaxID=56454 RepID=UPI003F6E129A